MPTICAKCGAPLESNAGFCPSCGTPIAASVPPMPPPSAVPGYGQPMGGYADYSAVPPKRSGGVLKIVLIVVAVVVGLGVLGVGILGYVGWRAMHAAGNSVSIGQTADVTESDLGVSVYPGAIPAAKGNMRMKMGNNLVVSALYTTGDTPSDVLAFYQNKLSGNGSTLNVTTAGDASTLTSSTVSGSVKESIVIRASPSPQADAGKTQIMIVHTKAVTP